MYDKENDKMNDIITIGDVVIVTFNNKQFFARVEKIEPDHSANKGSWWHVAFLGLTIPLQIVNWIVNENQMCGEPFTIQGFPVQINKVPFMGGQCEEVKEEKQTIKEESNIIKL